MTSLEAGSIFFQSVLLLRRRLEVFDAAARLEFAWGATEL
jgi:hypothetical protein